MAGEPATTPTPAVHWFDEPSPWWSAAQTAEYLGCSVTSVYGFAKNKSLRHVRLFARRELRFRREWIDAYLETLAAPVAIADRRRA